MLQIETKSNSFNNDFSQRYQVVPWVFLPLYYLAKNLVLPLYFGKISLTGRENIPEAGPMIIAPTHRSRWDGIVMAVVVYFLTKRKIRFMVTESEMTGLQGKILKRVGCFPVDINKPTLNSFRHSVEVLSNQEILVIFPEGGIFQDTEVHPIKSGIARIALQAQSMNNSEVKIIPVSLYYDNIHPQWGTNIDLDFGTPIFVSDYRQGSTKNNAQLLTKTLAEKITSLYGQKFLQLKK